MAPRTSVIVTALISVGIALSSVVPAHAGPLDVSCTGSRTATYNPGLTLFPQQVTYTATSAYAPCVSASDPTVVSGTSAKTGTGTFSCLVSNAASIETIQWSNGRTSTAVTNTVVNAKPGGSTVVVDTGTITQGEFAGDTVVQTVVLANGQPLACLTPQGVTSVSGAVEFEITSV